MISTTCCGPGPPLQSQDSSTSSTLPPSSSLSSSSPSSPSLSPFSSPSSSSSSFSLPSSSSSSSTDSSKSTTIKSSWETFGNNINYIDNNFKYKQNKIQKRTKYFKIDMKNNKSSEKNLLTTTNRTTIIKTTAPETITKLKEKTYYKTINYWIFTYGLIFLIILGAGTKVDAEKSKHYYMQSLCKNHFLQQLYRKIDGAVLWSQNERNLDCIITFQTHSILQRFMLRFDMLQLDCNDHLYVYDGAHAVGSYKADLSCRNTKQSVGSIFTRTNFVTLKYVTDGWGTDTNGFKLVITA